MTLLAMETQDLSRLVFHSDQLSIDDLHLYDSDMTELTIGFVSFDFQRTFVSISQSFDPETFEVEDFVQVQCFFSFFKSVSNQFPGSNLPHERCILGGLDAWQLLQLRLLPPAV